MLIDWWVCCICVVNWFCLKCVLMNGVVLVYIVLYWLVLSCLNIVLELCSSVLVDLLVVCVCVLIVIDVVV